jgi:hypothetical protein
MNLGFDLHSITVNSLTFFFFGIVADNITLHDNKDKKKKATNR